MNVPDLTKKEAAAVAGVSVDTIKRDLRKDLYPGTYKGADGVVWIPQADLVAAGRIDQSQVLTHESLADRRREENLQLLRAQHEFERRRAERAEAELERERAAADAIRRQLLATIEALGSGRAA